MAGLRIGRRRASARAGTAILLVGVVAALGQGACGASSRATDGRPLPLRVEYAGCETVLPGPTCARSGDRPLSLWVAAPPDARIVIDGEVQSHPGPLLLGGYRFDLELPTEDGELLVEARRGTLASTFRLALTRSPRPEWYRRSWSRARAGDDAGARRLAEARLASASLAEQGQALRILARLDQRAGRLEQARHRFEQAIPTLQRSGFLYDAVADGVILVHMLLAEGRPAEARSLLSELEPVPHEGESSYLLTYYRGLLASKTGDLRTALRALTAAVAQAERLGLEAWRIDAEQVLARELQRLGRVDEATLLFSLLPTGHETGALGPCGRAALLNNRAWALLLAREAGRRTEDPKPLLRRALELFEGDCRDYPDEPANVRVNLALAHFHDGQLGLSRSWLEEAGARSPEPLPELMLWAWDLDARLRLAEARPHEALALYQELAARAQGILSPEAEWRLAFWRARTLEAMGEVAEALAAYARAEGLLDQEILLVPMHEGRDTFIGQRERATRRHLDLLLASGRPAEALEVMRRAHSRYLRSLGRSVRISQLAPEERQAWERALAAHQARRQEVDRAAAEAWRLSGVELERAVQEQLRGLREARAELDARLARLDGGVRQGEARLARSAAGEVLLAYSSTPDGWLGFAADAQGVTARRLGRVEGLTGRPELLAERLLEPFAEPIARARAVRVLATGALEPIDFHALPFRGQPLLARGPVTYALDLPVTGGFEPGASPRALVVGDPRGDLPGARREARSVDRALRTRRPGWRVEGLLGAAATGPEVRSRLAGSALFHYAGHGVFAGWDSHLPLAQGHRLTLDDILALEPAPGWVVLSGCETAATSPLPGVGTLGLAQAWLAAGSRAVIAASRPVPDRVAAALGAALYAEWGPGVPAPEAFRRAQLALRAHQPEADWASFRILVP